MACSRNFTACAQDIAACTRARKTWSKRKRLQCRGRAAATVRQHEQLHSNGRQGESLITHIADAGARPRLIAEVVRRARAGRVEG
jgi:hypothetical protein